MAIQAFSADWAKAFKDEVNKSAAYKAAGKGWKWTVGLVVEAEPDRNFPEAKGVVMDLFEGEARDIRIGTASEAHNFHTTASRSASDNFAPVSSASAASRSRFRQRAASGVPRSLGIAAMSESKFRLPSRCVSP